LLRAIATVSQAKPTKAATAKTPQAMNSQNVARIASATSTGCAGGSTCPTVFRTSAT
jgi:hypothetical protein